MDTKDLEPHELDYGQEDQSLEASDVDNSIADHS